jgi:TolA-binding protein
MNGFDNLGETVSRELGTPPESLLSEQRRRFVQEASRARLVHWWQRPSAWAAAAAAVAALVTGGLLVLPGQKAAESAAEVRTNETAPTASANDVWLQGSPDAAPVSLDGVATVVLSASGRARLQRTSESVRRVSLENGRMDVDVDPAGGKTWSFLAGAYRVDVLGTKFTLDYDPDSGALEIAVRRGSVRVSGGKLGAGGVTLESGQRFQATDGVVQIDTEQPAQGESPTHERQDETAGGPTPRPAQPDWQSLHRSGDYAAALAAAERQGFDSLLQTEGPGALSALADTARLSGSSGRARQALLALRQRFPGTPAASKAAFLLGRLDGSPRWFAAYLQEQPSGAYAPEAAGRLVVAYRDTGDLNRARTAARQYLARYPQGAYAELARSLVDRNAPR